MEGVYQGTTLSNARSGPKKIVIRRLSDLPSKRTKMDRVSKLPDSLLNNLAEEGGLMEEVCHGTTLSNGSSRPKETEMSKLSDLPLKRMKMDRVSELPDSLLIHILSCVHQPWESELPRPYLLRYSKEVDQIGPRNCTYLISPRFCSALVKETAVTSVLSKRWRSLWAELPVLRFFEPNIRNNTRIVAMVDRAVAIRTAQHLEELYLQFWYHHTWASHVDVWLEFASKSKAKIISLVIPRVKETRYTLPEMLYCNSWLVELVLGYCVVAPQRRIHWKSLINLELYQLEVQEQVLENILSGCPVLNSLGLKRCWGFDCLNINSPTLDKLELWDFRPSLLKISAPNVRYLHVCLDHIEEKLQLTNISSLLKASVDKGFIGFLEAARHVPELEIGNMFLRCISNVVWRGPRLPQSTRISLIVKASFECKNLMIDGMISLLESSPKLEKLEIVGTRLRDVPSPRPLTDDNMCQLLRLIKIIPRPSLMKDMRCDLLHLKTIKMECFAGDPMLRLAQILLKRATALEKMLIHPNIKDKDEWAETVHELMAYPRSSKRAQVLIS